MNKKLFIMLLAVCISGSSHSQFTDSLWIIGGQGGPGDLISVEVWLQYEGGGSSDSIALFDIPLTYDATVCTVETITIGPDFASWTGNLSRIDNGGTQGSPAVSKIGVSALTLGLPVGPPWVEGGTHLAATVDFRILDTATPGDSTCIDTLVQAFSPLIYLGFVCIDGMATYVPSFSTGCIRVSSPFICGDVNADTRISGADRTYILSYIYFGGGEPMCSPIEACADVNLDGRITAADGTYILSYIYFGGPPPCNPPAVDTPFKERRMER